MNSNSTTFEGHNFKIQLKLNVTELQLSNYSRQQISVIKRKE